MATLIHAIKITGHGIHSGKPVTMVIRPHAHPGIYFRRRDLSMAKIPARYDNVGATHLRNTTVGQIDAGHVQTVEHLMAALFMAGVDRAIIDIDGPETPILDGSAHEFYALIAGAVDAPEFKKMRRIIVRRPVVAYAHEIIRALPLWTRIKIWVMNKIAHRRTDGYVQLLPGDDHTLSVHATLDYPEKIIGRQSYTYTFDMTKRSVNTFLRDIARARTFGKYSEWSYLKKHGMARGANEHNVIALNDTGDGTLNALTWGDEFVRHKIIDAIGDMATAGGFICGRMESYKGSHALNNLVLKKLFSDPVNYDIVDYK